MKLLDDVERYGFHMVRVGWSEADRAARPEWQDVPGWTYTIGFHVTFAAPEIVVFALPAETVKSILWDFARTFADGTTFEVGRGYRGALESFGEGQVFQLEHVAPEWADELFGFAEWFYKGDPFPVVSYHWPDSEGRFPWDPGVKGELRAAQPDLRQPPAAPGAPPPSFGSTQPRSQ